MSFGLPLVLICLISLHHRITNGQGVHARCTRRVSEDLGRNPLYQGLQTGVSRPGIPLRRRESQRRRAMASQMLGFWWRGALLQDEIHIGDTEGMKIHLAGWRGARNARSAQIGVKHLLSM